MSITYEVAVTGDVVRPDGGSVHGDLGLERLIDARIGWRVVPASGALQVDDLAQIDAVLSMGHARFDAELLRQLPRLRHIARFGAGFDTIDLAACSRQGIVVTNAPQAVRAPLALAGLTLLLALVHNLVPKDRLVRTSRWDQCEQYRGASLVGRTVGIVGYGSVGAELARLLEPLGVRLVGHNRSGRRRTGTEVEMLSLNETLEVSDYLILCAALTPETDRMIGESQIARMKDGARLINIGRGRLVDTAALRTALLSGKLAGAALDVFDPEPLSPDDPLLELDNVVLSPHALCWTDDFTAAVSTSAINAIIAVAGGERPANVVNPDVFSGRAQ